MCLSKTILIGRDKWVVGYKIFRSYEEGLRFDIYPEMHKGVLSPDVVYEDKRKTKIWSDDNTGYSQEYMTGYHFYLDQKDAIGAFKQRGHPGLQLWQCYFTNITAVGYQQDSTFSPPTCYPAAVARKMRIVHQVILPPV
jgi:hypothetical protein